MIKTQHSHEILKKTVYEFYFEILKEDRENAIETNISTGENWFFRSEKGEKSLFMMGRGN